MSGSPSPATRAKLMAQFLEFKKKRKSAKTKENKKLATTVFENQVRNIYTTREIKKTKKSPNKISVRDEYGNVVKTFDTKDEAQEWMAEQNRITLHGRVHKKKTRKSRTTRKKRNSTKKKRTSKRSKRKSKVKTRVSRKTTRRPRKRT